MTYTAYHVTQTLYYIEFKSDKLNSPGSRIFDAYEQTIENNNKYTYNTLPLKYRNIWVYGAKSEKFDTSYTKLQIVPVYKGMLML